MERSQTDQNTNFFSDLQGKNVLKPDLTLFFFFLPFEKKTISSSSFETVLWSLSLSALVSSDEGSLLVEGVRLFWLVPELHWVVSLSLSFVAPL